MKRHTWIWFMGSGLIWLWCLGVLIPDWDVPAWRELIRGTARTSLLFFLLAYTAQAAWATWPHAATQWVREQRRDWGLLLLTSHGTHLIGIVMFWQLDATGFAALVPVANLYSGGLAYAFLLGMGLTSFAPFSLWAGPRFCSVVHRWGMHYLWLSFVVANGKRIPQNGWYALPVVLLLMAAAWRWLAQRHGSLQLNRC